MYRSLVIPSPELTPHSRTNNLAPPVTRDRSPHPPLWAQQQGGNAVATSGTSASFPAAGTVPGTQVGRTLSPQRVKRNMLSASPLRATAASPLRGLRGSPVGVPTEKRMQQDPTVALSTTCRGIEVGRDGEGGAHLGAASTPPPGVAADFQQTIDRLRSDNAACQARLDVLVEANRQRKYVMPVSDYKREGDHHLSDMIRFGSSDLGTLESNEGLMKPLNMSRPLPDGGCSASTQDLFFKLRTDLDNSQAHASSLDKAILGLRRELHSVREQLLQQSSQTQRFVQDLRRDVDALRNGGSIGGHLSSRSCGQSVRHGGLSPVVGRESAGSPGIGDMQLQELRSELLDLRGALRTVDAECRRIAATSAGPPSWPSDGRRRIAAEDSILQPLHEELQGLRLDVQRLEQETAPLARSVGALWAEVDSFRAGVSDPSQAWTHAPLAATGTAPLSTSTSVGMGVSQQRALVSPRNATMGCSAGFHLLQPHLSSSGQMLLQDADPRIALLQGPHSLEHQALYLEKGCYSVPGTGRSHMAVVAMTAAEEEEACRKMVAVQPKQPVVEHSTLDSTLAREDLLRALQAVQEMQDHDMPLLRCGLLSSDSDSCRE